jgi:hypothetical protein
MGNKSKFKKEPKQFRLTFAEGEEYFGLEVLMRSVTIDRFLKNLDDSPDMTNTQKSDQVAAGNRYMLKQFSANLVEWNLTDEYDKDVPPVYAQCIESGKDIPDSGKCADHVESEDDCAVTGVLSQEMDFILVLYLRWQTAMAGVDNPLLSGLLSGKPSPEESLPME